MELAFVLDRKTQSYRDPHPAKPCFMYWGHHGGPDGPESPPSRPLCLPTFSGALIMDSIEIPKRSLKLYKISSLSGKRNSPPRNWGRAELPPHGVVTHAAPPSRVSAAPAADGRSAPQNFHDPNVQDCGPGRRARKQEWGPPGDHGGSGRPLGTCEVGVLCHFVQNHDSRWVKVCKGNHRGNLTQEEFKVSSTDHTWEDEHSLTQGDSLII